MDIDASCDKEWIITNGIGGYASSSVCGANTRRYHGLLVAAYQPPTGRHVLVSKVEEKVIAGQEEFLLSTNTYPGTVHPEGYRYLASFERYPFPESVFAFDRHKLVKRTWMHYGRNTTAIEYANNGPETFRLILTPLLVCRDYHHLFHESDEWSFDVTHIGENRIRIAPSSFVPPLYMSYSKGAFDAKPGWYRRFTYVREQERGLDDEEDAKTIGAITCDLGPGEKVCLIFCDNANELSGDPHMWAQEETARIEKLVQGVEKSFIRDLMISGDQFLVRRDSSSSYSLIAGYHWFTDWGRDTMIAMRGLIIATGRKEEARSILSTFLHYLDRGMIPNRFPDSGEAPEYNTIDATLWLFVALYDYYDKFRDLAFIASLYSALTNIIQAHIDGTRYNIQVTPEGLLYGGVPGVQLTWMDAMVDDTVVTPRTGCPVEINALWYNALSVYALFGHLLDRDVSDIAGRIASFRPVFQQYFVNDRGYLHDVVIPGQNADDAIRPNMIYAVSLPFSPLTPEQQKQVMVCISEHLYTGYGLRSLSPSHPDFRHEFTGDRWQRDHAYHQGTVWSFLWGEYALAWLNVHGYSAEARQWVKQEAEIVRHHFYHENGLYAISENFDGGAPGPGKGCIQQAWSVGMTLLALLEAEKFT